MRVTITGADDNVNPLKLEWLSKTFPFVEWGILHSKKMQSSPRYPSQAWIERFALSLPYYVKRSLHICGAVARSAAKGILKDVPFMGFGRVQVNGYQVGQAEQLKKLDYFCKVILQCRKEEELPLVVKDSQTLEGADILFDPSGGRGIETVSWPATPKGCNLGFAGGINPDNILDVLKAIGPRPLGAWIDMESGVRTDDEFDLDKVYDILYKVKMYGGVRKFPLVDYKNINDTGNGTRIIDGIEYAIPGCGTACGAANDCCRVRGHLGDHINPTGSKWPGYKRK